MKVGYPFGRALLAAGVLLILSGCCSGKRRLNVSQDGASLVVGDSVRPQWSVSSGSEECISGPDLHYDNYDSPQRFAWQSSALQVATVDRRGMIRGVAPGKAVVTATTRGLTSSIPVIVRAAPDAR